MVLLVLNSILKAARLRKQCVIRNRTKTLYSHTQCGLPQGSILGPLLFPVHISELHLASEVLFILYANTNNIFLTDKEKNEHRLITHMNNVVDGMDVWFKRNKLTLNIKKGASSLNIEAYQIIPAPFSELIMHLNIKFLGVIIYDQPNWKDHIGNVSNKVEKILVF